MAVVDSGLRLPHCTVQQ